MDVVDGQQKNAEGKMRLSKRFVQSGEKDKLKELLRARLVACGWHDAMKQHGKGRIVWWAEVVVK